MNVYLLFPRVLFVSARWIAMGRGISPQYSFPVRSRLYLTLPSFHGLLWHGGRLCFHRCIAGSVADCYTDALSLGACVRSGSRSACAIPLSVAHTSMKENDRHMGAAHTRVCARGASVASVVWHTLRLLSAARNCMTAF